MDKRSILFIILVTLSLYFFHSYFSPKTNVSATQKEQTEEVATLPSIAVSKLPLVEIYANSEGTEYLSLGLLSKNSLTTLAWTESMPKQVYYRKYETHLPLQQAKLIQKSLTESGPVIYRQNPNGETTEVALPETGTFDVQVITFDSANKEVNVYPAQFIEGYLSIPGNNLPTTNGIILFQKGEELFLAGIYVHKESALIPLKNFIGFKDLITQQPLDNKKNEAISTPQKFFVLENEYQQLVFSNYGGALTEINLPFQSKSNNASVVKETEIDRELTSKLPSNSKYPDYNFFTPASSPTNLNFEKHTQETLGGYYPLLRRNLITSSSATSITVPPRFYALNIISDYPEVAELIYDVTYFDHKKIVFEAKQNHRRITKTFSLPEDSETSPYVIDLTIQIEGDSRGLWITSGIPEAELVSGSPAPYLSYRVMHNQKGELEKVSLPKNETSVSSVTPEWLSNSNGFFSVIIDPLSDIKTGFKANKVPGTIVPSRLSEMDQTNYKFKKNELPGYEFLLPLPSNNQPVSFRIYAGPLDSDILKLVDRTYTDSISGYNPEYIQAQTYHGFFAFISEPFAKILFIIMKFFFELTHSWAFAIILLTVVLRVMLYPLNAWSFKSMKKMQLISPEISKIQAKHKKDPKKAQLEIMDLYRKRGVNPFSGCLPILIQMPFLVGMFDLLKSTFALRGASFIPGWIDNLTAPDVLFSWKMPIFFIGNEFHLLPILLGLVMYLQQKISSSAPKDKSLMTDQQKQQRFMGNIMVVVFTIMFYKFPSGLNIYWLSSMLLGILQQWLTNRYIDRKSKTGQKTVSPSKVVKIKGQKT